MFRQAFNIAISFTRPVVVSSHTIDGTVTSGVATFIVVNDEGLALTAAHVVQAIVEMDKSVAQTQRNLRLKEAIEASGAPESDRQHQIEALGIGVDDLQNYSQWWSQDAAWSGGIVAIDPIADLAVVKLNDFDASGITFPRFRRLPPDKQIPAGRSLLKIGYPFATVQSSFDPSTNLFKFNTDDLVPFPVDGILTRAATVTNSHIGGDGAFLMTSTPGLKGQSGGPTVDVDGTIWAVQSQTLTLDLDFIGSNGGVRQFLNVGLGCHPAAIEALLAKAGVAVEWVDVD
jgi:hypothetical protein